MMINSVDHLFLYLLTICISPLENELFRYCLLLLFRCSAVSKSFVTPWTKAYQVHLSMEFLHILKSDCLVFAFELHEFFVYFGY